jgi:hypothetical protein
MSKSSQAQRYLTEASFGGHVQVVSAELLLCAYICLGADNLHAGDNSHSKSPNSTEVKLSQTREGKEDDAACLYLYSDL